MRRLKLNKRTIDALKPEAARYTAWDEDISGYGLRVMPTGERVYILKFRINARQRWMTIGRHGSPWTPELARREAVRLLGEVARGIDPADKRDIERAASTFGEVCDLYMAEGVSHKKASTLRSDRGRIDLHLKPLLGRKRVDAINRADIERLLTDVKGAKTAAPVRKKGERRPGSIATGGVGVASQCVALASTVLKFAVDRGMRPDNPASGVKKPASRKMERYLSEAELTRLANALKAEVDGGGNIYPVAAIKLLALTGCRRNEVVGLRWQHVDIERMMLHLPDSKTGEKPVFLSPPAAVILTELPRIAGNDHVIVGALAGKPFAAIDKVWSRVRKAAGLDGVRMHDLRHTFASYGAAGGLGLPIVGKLLGHTQSSTTQRYAHLADDPLRRASDQIGATISAAMGGGKKSEVIELFTLKKDRSGA